MPTAKTTRVFISFDYDHDDDVRVMLLGQAKHRDTPFSFENWSIKQETEGWKEDARKRIRRCDVVIVICGHYTGSATGVAAEIAIAREKSVPYHLLKGRKTGTCQKPKGTSNTIQPWTWDAIGAMCGMAPTPTPWWKKLF